MKFVHFWRTAVKELSLSEKKYYRDMLEKISEWQSLMEQYPEFKLIRKILESEIPSETNEDLSQEHISASSLAMKSLCSLKNDFSWLLK